MSDLCSATKMPETLAIALSKLCPRCASTGVDGFLRPGEWAPGTGNHVLDHLVRVPRFGRIEGRINPAPPAGSEVALAGPRVGLGRQETVIAADGTFVFENVPPGPVRLAADFIGHYVESIRFGGRAVAATEWTHELVVPESPVSDLEVTISNRMGTLSGRVVDDKGNPVPQHRVALHPYRYGSTVTDQNGDFRLAELRPGAYEVSPCPGQREKVRIEAGATSTVSLRACTQR